MDFDILFSQLIQLAQKKTDAADIPDIRLRGT